MMPGISIAELLNTDPAFDSDVSPNTSPQSLQLPSTPKRRYLDRDTRLKILTLHDLGWKYQSIVTQLNVTLRQIGLVVKAGHPTPSKRPGKRPLFDTPKRQDIVGYVCRNKVTRRMTYAQLADVFECTIDRIRLALRKEGYSRRVARKKPPISEATRQVRLAWAYEHLNWTREQWDQILWSDETWVTGKKHTRTWVTRRPDEVFHPDCVEKKNSAL